MPNKQRATGDSGADMVNGPGMITSHRRKRSASPSLPRYPPNDGDRSAKKLKTNKRARSASPSLPHRSPTNSNRSAKKSKRTHHSDDVIPVWMGGASASTPNNGPSPVPSPAPVDSRSTEKKKDQQAHRTVNHKRTRSASPSLPHRPHRPPIDSDRSAKKLKSTHKSGDTILVPPREEEGVSRHDNGPYPVPSLPPVDSISTERNQQAHEGILPASEKPDKRKNEVILNVPHRPKPTLEMPAANGLRLPQKTRSVFSEPKSGWKSVSVGWGFGGPPLWRERDDWD